MSTLKLNVPRPFPVDCVRNWQKKQVLFPVRVTRILLEVRAKSCPGCFHCDWGQLGGMPTRKSCFCTRSYSPTTQLRKPLAWLWPYLLVALSLFSSLVSATHLACWCASRSNGNHTYTPRYPRTHCHHPPLPRRVDMSLSGIRQGGPGNSAITLRRAKPRRASVFAMMDLSQDTSSRLHLIWCGRAWPLNAWQAWHMQNQQLHRPRGDWREREEGQMVDPNVYGIDEHSGLQVVPQDAIFALQRGAGYSPSSASGNSFLLEQHRLKIQPLVCLSGEVARLTE